METYKKNRNCRKHRREQTVKEDSEFYESMYGVNPLHHVNYRFMCYQTAHKKQLDEIFGMECNRSNTLVVMDECHQILSPVYFNFVENNLLGKNIPCIGLSATIDGDREFEYKGVMTTKLEMLNLFCPIIFKYTLNQSWENETSRKLKFYIINHQLDGKSKNIEAGKKGARFMTTEYSMYDWLEKNFRKSLFLPKSDKKDFMVRTAASARARFLYALPSKIPLCQELLSKLDTRTILFGNSVESLLQITPNCITSHNSAEKNNEILSNFQTGKIDVIGSFKMLEQGANLRGLDNIIMHSYYGKTKSTIQKLGRLRVKGNELGHVFIIVTKGTQELSWFNSMTEDLDFDVVQCDSVSEAIKKYYENKN